MLLITAIINKENLSDVVQSFLEEGFYGFTIIDVIPKDIIISNEDYKDYNPKAKIDIVVSNKENKEKVMDIIRNECQDITYGAGKMWVTEVLEVERIRTGEKDLDALTQNKHQSIKKDFYYGNAKDTPSS